MKCKKCGQKAALNMPQHHMGLCKPHFLEWVPEQVERFIQKYEMFTRDEKILIAVSGGKDSISLWDILLRLGYEADGVYICLGIDDGINYSAESQRIVEEFACNRGLTLHVVNVQKETGKTIPEWSSISNYRRGKPCSTCGLIKRHEMNRIASELDYKALATGHNLDDEVAVLFGNTLSWAGDYLLRQGPVLPESPGLVRKVKPLFRFYEREMTAYALMRGLDYIYAECPYSVGASSIRYKELLNQLEHDQPGVKLSFYLKFLHAREEGLFGQKEEKVPKLQPCQKCGQPTSSPELCSFCRMIHTIPG